MGDENLLARFEEHIVGLGLAPATIANYLADVHNFTTWFSESALGRLPLVDASAEHVRHYCQSLRKQGRSTSTINRRLQAVRKFYDFIGHIGLASRNPARDVERVNERSDTSPRILTADEVNSAFEAAAAAGPLSPYLEYSTEPLVSTDIVHSPASCTFDSELTMANGSFAKVFGWYDNEWGYSCRLVDLVSKLL